MKIFPRSRKLWIIGGILVAFLIWPITYPTENIRSVSSCEYAGPSCGFTVAPRGYYLISHPHSYYGFMLHPFSGEWFGSYGVSQFDYCSLSRPLACANEYVAIPVSVVAGAWLTQLAISRLVRKERLKS